MVIFLGVSSYIPKNIFPLILERISHYINICLTMFMGLTIPWVGTLNGTNL